MKIDWTQKLDRDRSIFEQKVRLFDLTDDLNWFKTEFEEIEKIEKIEKIETLGVEAEPRNRTEKYSQQQEIEVENDYELEM